jgi:predicted nucleic-acid-binding protein
VIGLDSNILVRYFTQDDPVQAALATDVLENRLSADDEPGFISVVAMAETVWVLDRHYHFTSEQIAAAVENLLQAEILVVENEAAVFVAVAALREGRGEFADALIGALCASAGCSRVYSFDRLALRLPGFEQP